MDIRKIAVLLGGIDIVPSLRLYLPFNEGGGNETKDYSQYGNNGILTDVEWGVNGCRFNGTSSYVNCGNGTSLNITDTITIEAWAKFDSLSALNNLISKYRNNGGYTMRVDGDGNFEFSISTGTEYDVEAIANPSLSEWHHIVGTYDGETVKLYIDSAFDNENTNASGNIATPNPNVNLMIGKDQNDGMFNGTIDEVRIYNRALSASEILNDYESERGVYGV